MTLKQKYENLSTPTRKQMKVITLVRLVLEYLNLLLISIIDL